MSVRLGLILAALVFLFTLLSRLPASVLLAYAPAALHCTGVSGTIWRGGCGELAFGPRSVSDVRWTLHPGALLRARVALDLASADPDAIGQAALEWQPGGALRIEQLAATLAPRALATLLPAGWSGSARLAIAHARVSAGRLTALEGTFELLQLQWQLRTAHTALGSYQLVFPPAAGAAAAADAPMLGTLHDLDGPLSLHGQMRLTPQGSYELSGRVAAREDAGASLQQLLELLGPPAADGSRGFSFAGTL
jgi:hypothetical protein